jgi:hypothetical protein
MLHDPNPNGGPNNPPSPNKPTDDPHGAYTAVAAALNTPTGQQASSTVDGWFSKLKNPDKLALILVGLLILAVPIALVAAIPHWLAQ